MANTTQTFGLGLLLLGTLALSAEAQVNHNHVLVIDEGVDLQHSAFQKNSFINQAEKDGVIAIDDDKNGFIDDVSGWNMESNDANYFPQWIRESFVKNAAVISKVLRLYDLIEDGNQEALEAVRKDRNLAQALNAVLGWSHGTHVGGIVVRYGNSEAQISSANVFTSGTAPRSPGSDDNDKIEAPSFAKNALSTGNSMARLRRLISENIVAPPSTETENPEKPFVSQFDDTTGITSFLMKLRQQEMKEKRQIARYVSAIKPRVVNLSLGSQKFRVQQALDGMWEEELLAAKMPANTRRTELQEKNYQRMLSEVFEAFRASWNELFRSNPGTLFVVAAGNDGAEGSVTNPGNNGINEVLPANCSKDNPNVITVAATNPQGVIADFSNYNETLVNVGAWGTAVPSLAPNNNTVKMSGTSMASPLVAGVASKVIANNPRLSPAQVRQILEGTVKKIASLKGKVSSEGQVDAQAALDAAKRALRTNLSAAIQESIKLRDNRGGMNFFSSLSGNGDESRAGQVHRTPALVKQFMR